MIERRLFKKTNIFYQVFDSIRWELDSLQGFISETAKTLISKQKDLEDQYDKAKAAYGEDDDGVDLHFTDEFDRYHTVYPSYTYNSLLVNQFSFLERHLRYICEVYETKKFSRVKLSDLNGSDIDKCRKYLTLVAEIDFTAYEKAWQRIRFIQKLRNATIHHANEIQGDSDTNLISQIKAEKMITFSANRKEYFIHDVQFLLDFNGVMLAFFENLVAKLSATKVLAKNSTMPYNNDKWGQEKSYNILEEVVNCLDLIKKAREKQEEITKDEILNGLELFLGTMTYMRPNCMLFS